MIKIRVQEPHPIYDQNGQNRHPIYDQNGLKTLPFGAAYTYIAHIRECPQGKCEVVGVTVACWNLASIVLYTARWSGVALK